MGETGEGEGRRDGKKTSGPVMEKAELGKVNRAEVESLEPL